MKLKILIVGANGMVGNTFLRYLSGNKNYFVAGTVRKIDTLKEIIKSNTFRLFDGIDATRLESFFPVFEIFNPDVVINCIGSIKQKNSSAIECIKINSLLPHYLLELSKKFKARFIHLSTDCVFSGLNGNYKETDFPDALDLYGRSKLLGEVNAPNSLTLRTSIIGHELNSNKSLLNWFLSQNKSVKGYCKAIFSGLSAYEYARIISEFVISNHQLKGLFHISSRPISKYDLLKLIKKVYKTNLDIEPDKKIVINRSLDSSKFCKYTNYKPKSWNLMIEEMKKFR